MNTFTLDLHGQHVDEALASLERWVVIAAELTFGLGHLRRVLVSTWAMRLAAWTGGCFPLGWAHSDVRPSSFPTVAAGHSPPPHPHLTRSPYRYLVTLGGLGHPGGVLLQVITGVGRHRCACFAGTAACVMKRLLICCSADLLPLTVPARVPCAPASVALYSTTFLHVPSLINCTSCWPHLPCLQCRKSAAGTAGGCSFLV